MPYVSQERRNEELDAILEPIIRVVVRLSKGDVNYLITRIVARKYATRGYTWRSEGAGVFLDALLEYVRRVIVSYEDKKIATIGNGDIPEYISADRELGIE